MIPPAVAGNAQEMARLAEFSAVRPSANAGNTRYRGAIAARTSVSVARRTGTGGEPVGSSMTSLVLSHCALPWLESNQ
jgi:hypothetical protein